MKNQVKKELVALAQSIIEQENNMDFITIYFKTRQLYEKAAVMNYLERMGGDLPSEIKSAFSSRSVSGDSVHLTSSPIEKPKTKEVKTDKSLEDFLSTVSTDIIFEDKREVEKRKSLNDNFTKSTKIGLNDRIAFIKHLFDGDENAFFNTLKKIDNTTSANEALQFVKIELKPKYGYWKGKEAYEERFVSWVVNKFS